MNLQFTYIDRWLAVGDRVVLATVVDTWGSSPRGLGSKMAVNSKGDMVGSVSGGCVEGAVVQESLEVLEKGGSKLLSYGVTDDEAWDVGLACGGEITIFIRGLDVEVYRKIKEGFEGKAYIAIASVIDGPAELIGKEIVITEDENVKGDAHSLTNLLYQAAIEALKNREIKRKFFKPEEVLKLNFSNPNISTKDLDVFVDIVMPQPTLIIIGGVHIAIALVEFANILGFSVVLIDPRKKFANHTRFPSVNQIINLWPQIALKNIDLNHSTAIAVLTHDPKIDDPALIAALSSPAFYIGALGSKATQDKRRKRMKKAGFRDEDVRRIRGPIGLNLGSKTPEEIALGIMAEIIQEKNLATRQF